MMARSRRPEPAEPPISRDLTMLNKAWAEAARMALKGDKRELRIRIQLASLTMGRHIDDSFLHGLNLAIAVASQLDGVPCCYEDGLTKKQIELFNEGQKQATDFIVDHLKMIRERYVGGMNIDAAEKILMEHVARENGNA